MNLTASPAWGDAGLTASRYLVLLLEILESRGIDATAVLAGSGLSRTALESAGSYVSASELQKLLANAERLSNDRLLGMALGKQLNLSAHGTIGFTGMTAANARDAIAVAVEDFALVTALVQLHFAEGATQSRITIQPAPGLDPASERFVVQTLISSIDLMGTFLLGQYQPSFRIDLTWPQEPGLQACLGAAISSLTFDQPQHCIHLSSHLLDIPFALADSRAHAQGRQRCQRELQQLQRQQGHAARLYQYLLQQAEQAPSIEDIASALNVSSRTVHRQLEAEGVGFRELLNEARMTRARHYLLREGCGITETAHRLGYQDSANFTRAFKRHMGMTPSAYLRQHDSTDPSP
jgi:AraC-like DNA-binding protein